MVSSPNPSDNLSFEGKTRLFSWLISFAVFFLLPTLLINFGVDRLWSRQEAASVDLLYEGLDEMILRVRQRENTEQYFSRILEVIHRTMASYRNDPPRRLVMLGKMLKRLRKRFPGLLRIFVTDSNGDRIPELSDAGVPNGVLRKFFRAAVINEGKEFDKILPILKAFIGEGVKVGELCRDRRLLEVGVTKEFRWFCHATDPLGSVIMHIHHSPDWTSLAVKDLLSLYHRLRPKSAVKLGLYDIASKIDAADPVLHKVIGEFQQTTRSHMRHGDSLYSIVQLNATERLWASCSASRALDRQPYRLLLNGFSVVFLAATGLLSFFATVISSGFVTPISFRLIFLFLYSSGLPLGLIIFAQWDYLDQLRQIRTREAFDEAERALMAFDGRYSQMRSQLEKEIHAKLDVLTYETPRQKQRLKKVLQKIYDKYALQEIHLISKNGELLLQERDGKVYNESDPNWAQIRKITMPGKFLASLVQNACAQINKEEVPVKMDASVMFTGPTSGNPLVREMGRMLDFAYGHEKKWYFVAPFWREKKISCMVILFWNRDNLERFYLKKNIPQMERTLPHLKIRAMKTNELKKFFPGQLTFGGRVESVAEATHLRQGTVFRQYPWEGGLLFATGIKAREIMEHYLFAFGNDAKVRQEMDVVRKNMAAFTFGIFLISLFLGVILAKRFLSPIRSLSEGVRAIEKRQFKFRLPPFDPDELGQLALVFNRVMGGLSDLEVGRIVQESLFPKGEIVVPPYRVFGVSHTASELGGDYFDLKRLADGRILMLVGDVSGHGVPAALVMAMAKALIEHFPHEAFTLESCFSEINSSFFPR